jgi:hypothetical protein
MLIDALADYLQTQGLGTVATNVFVGFLPAKPDTLTALYTTGGPPPDARLGYDNLAFQVRTRGATPRSAYERAMAIYAVLHGLHNTTIGTIDLVDCLAIQSSPVNIGRDEAGRFECSQNYRARIRNPTTHRM